MCWIYSSFFFGCLQLKAKCLFFTVKFSLIKILEPPTNWCFFQIILSNCFLLSSAFLQYFLLTNLIMVFLEPLLDLPILWHSSTSLDSMLTSISERIDATVDSRSESWILSGMPEITKLFLLLYCSRASWEDCIRATLFSNCWYLTQSLSFSSCSLLMAVSFRLIISSFKLLILSDCNWTWTQNHLVCKWTLSHLARLWTKWFWIRVQLQSLKLQISRLLQARSSFTFRQLQSVDSHVRDMIRRYRLLILLIILASGVWRHSLLTTDSFFVLVLKAWEILGM